MIAGVKYIHDGARQPYFCARMPPSSIVLTVPIEEMPPRNPMIRERALPVNLAARIVVSATSTVTTVQPSRKREISSSV